MPTLRTLASLCLLAAVAAPAFAASNLKVAAVGDGAPDGGVFAGPSFTAWPTAAGDGWIAFRSLLEGGSASEAIIAAHLTNPVTRVQIARVGQKVDGAGTIRALLGRPNVNAGGDVAFFATYRRDDGSIHTGIFLYDADAPVSTDPLHRIVDDGDPSDAGTIDLDQRVEPDTDPADGDTAERAPAINATGAITFVAATDDGGIAIFRRSPGGSPEAVVRKGDAYDGGTFTAFGGPALSAGGTIAFRGLVAGAPTADGIYTDDGAGAVLRVGSGQIVSAMQAGGALYGGTLEQFGNGVSLNDAGDIAFTAGLRPTDSDPLADAEYSTCVFHAGMTFLIGFRNQSLSLGRVTSVRLGPNGGTLLTPPAIAPDGTVTFSVEISDGAIEALRRIEPPYGLNDTETPVIFAGQTSTPDPTGGKYRSITSAVAVDGDGAVVFFARMAGGTSSSAVIYLPTAGDPSAITQGEPSPATGSGYFSGPAFSGPGVTDAGDVIYKAFVARGSTSVGIFKTHIDRQTDGTIVRTTTRMVGANDLIPDGTGAILDIVGDPDVSGDGTVAFTALVDGGHGRGVYRILADGTLTLVADRDVGGPGDVVFSSVGLSPAINRDGTVAFRSGVRSLTPGVPSTEGIFLFDGNGFAAQVLEGDATTGGNFTRLRDPAVSSVPSIAFRANVRGPESDAVERGGMFLHTGTDLVTVATQNDDLGGGVRILDFSGAPSMSDDGDVAFQVSRVRDGVELGGALLRRRNGDLEQVVAVGTKGPMGGTFRSISAPTMAPKGRIAFRGAVDGGGVGGLFVVGDAGLRPYALSNDGSPIGGRYSSFGTKLSLNAKDDLAFTATVSGGDARSGVFVASPTVLLAPNFLLRLSGGQKRDRLNLGLTLSLGRLTNDVDPTTEQITVTVSDGSGVLQQFKVNPGTLERKGKRFVVANGKSLPDGVRLFRIVAGRRKSYRTVLKSAPLDLTLGGTRPVSTPLSATVEIGDDAGTFIGRCQLRLNGARCGGG